MMYARWASAAIVSLALVAVACGGAEEDAAPASAGTPEPAREFPAPVATPTPNPTQAAAQPIIRVGRAVPRIEDFEGPTITPDEASAMGGQQVKVCGKIAEIVAHPTRTRIWVFNFEMESPNQTFSLIVGKDPQRRHGIWPPNPETYYVGKTMCAVARVEFSDGNPYMIINHSDQVEEVEQ